MIETERLLLRQYAPDDVPAILSLTSDASIRKFVGNLLNTEEEAWARVLRCAGHWSLFGCGTLAAVERASGRIVGEVGAANFHRGVDVRLDRAMEASWLFATECQGKGYAFEAMSALIGWIDNSTPYSTLSCLIEVINLPSIKLSEKLGFSIVDSVSYRDKAFHLLIR